MYSIKFNPTGTILASASHDSEVRKQITTNKIYIYIHNLLSILTQGLWNVHGKCDNFLTFKQHSNAVLDIQWSLFGDQLASCSADKSVVVVDVESNELVKKFTGHKGVVNSVTTSRSNNAVVGSGSNDKTVRIWDTRLGRRGHATVIRQEYPVTAVAFSKDGNTIYSGGIDNVIRGWDIRMDAAALASEQASAPAYVGDSESRMDVESDNESETAATTSTASSEHKVKLELAGHTNTITGLAFSHDGSYLLSNAMDGRLRIWDTRPYAASNRCVKIFQGHKHSFDMSLLKCAWSVDGRFVSAGSSDGLVNVWNTTNRTIAYKLTGHTGVVHDVQFHPREQIIASCSADKSILLGELKI